MRGRLGLLMNPSGVGSTTIGKATKLVSRFAFSTSSSGDGFGGSGGGGGRGRGRGIPGPSTFNFVAGVPDSNESSGEPDGSLPSAVRGHGTSFVSLSNGYVAPDPPAQQASWGRGGPVQQGSEVAREEGAEPKRPVFLKKDEFTGASVEAESVASVPREPVGEKNLPENILNVLSGRGRGVHEKKPLFEAKKIKEENRHLRPKPIGAPAAAEGGIQRNRPEKGSVRSEGAKPKLSREEAVKNAVGMLSRGDDRKDTGRFERGGRRQRGGKSKDDEGDDEGDGEGDDEDIDEFLPPGDDADGEKFAEALGPSTMAELTEAFDDMAFDVLPDPEEDEYLEAYDTNLKIELEPEYLMGDFETNPDIDEKPPIPLREALEKMKPFLMSYEGIENQEEWEQIVEETMDKVPLMKEIVDHYCGPDTVTAEQQKGELERVAKTLPASAPNSVKLFTNRAVLSLQSNPGWEFHRKWQFMDKLVAEVSKSHK